MKKQYIYGVLPIFLLVIMAQLSSCSSEHFVDATQITIFNHDTIPLTIYVDGEEATSFESFWGEVHLNSGSYEITAKSDGKEIDKINVSISGSSEVNWDKHIFSVGGDKSYVLCDMRYIYFNGHDIELEETYFNESYLHIESSNQHTYYPWNILPMSLYAYEGSTVEVQQLFMVPNDFKDKDEETILNYCEAKAR